MFCFSKRALVELEKQNHPALVERILEEGER